MQLFSHAPNPIPMIALLISVKSPMCQRPRNEMTEITRPSDNTLRIIFRLIPLPENGHATRARICDCIPVK